MASDQSPSDKKVVSEQKSENGGSSNANNNIELKKQPVKPPKASRWTSRVLTLWTSICKFCYNDKDNSYFGRTPLSWFQITLFYVCFYGFLAAYWAACYYCLVEVYISDEQPSYILQDSLIAGNDFIVIILFLACLSPTFSGFGTPYVKPGLSVVPNTQDFLTHDGHKLVFNLNEKWTNVSGFNNDSVNNFLVAQTIQTFFDDHRNGTVDDEQCSIIDDDLSDKDRVCAFDYDELGPCANYPYGYALDNQTHINPCLYLKINRVLHFVPEPYDQFDKDGKINHPLSWVNTSRLEGFMLENPNKVYVECHAKHSNNQAQIENSLVFYPPDGGISFKYFPYTRIGPLGDKSATRQRSALVALQIQADSFPHNQEIDIECFPFYKHVVHDRKTLQGLVRFSVKIDSDDQ